MTVEIYSQKIFNLVDVSAENCPLRVNFVAQKILFFILVTSLNGENLILFPTFIHTKKEINSLTVEISLSHKFTKYGE